MVGIRNLDPGFARHALPSVAHCKTWRNAALSSRYGKALLRITHAVSRCQEFAADEFAVRLVGSRPVSEGFKLIHGAALAFNAYWRNDVVPVLSRGFHAPMAEGFHRHFTSPQIVAVFASINVY
jgi:hypothetical protein